MNKPKIPKIVKFLKIKDNRGQFAKLYSQSIKKKLFFNIKEINYSFNKNKGTLRGIHFQGQPKNEEKIVCCLKGSIFDVTVDLRKNSKNFFKYKTFKLDDTLNQMLYIPKGFAHGFQTLSDNTILIYMHSEKFYKKLDKGIHPFDKLLNIKWPIKKKIMSPKDNNLKSSKYFKGL